MAKPTTSTGRERRHNYREIVPSGPLHAAWINCTAPWRDSHDLRFSLTKLLASFFAIMDWHSIEASPSHQLTANHLWLAIVCLAAAFGKSTFNFALKRMALRSQLNASDETKRETKHETQDVRIETIVKNARDAETGEPLPTAPGQEP